MRSTTAAAIFAALGVVFSQQVAYAEIKGDEIPPITIVRVPNSPAELTRCQFARGLNFANSYSGSVVVQNRTRHQMGDVHLTMTAYDVEGVKMDVQDISARPTELVAPGDTGPYKMGVNFNLSGQDRFLARLSCRITSAQFSGYSQPWTTAKRWPEKLLPMVEPEKSNDTMQNDRSTSEASESTLARGASGAGRTVANVAPSVGIQVSNAWNDTVNGNILVHVALDMQGGARDATLTPQNLTLMMALANGGKKAYPALSTGAPTFEKFNPLGSTTTTSYEVEPKEDLGRIGSIIVPAHGAVKVVATFLLGHDVVANPNDNRNVALK